jgi:hypothetical protein
VGRRDFHGHPDIDAAISRRYAVLVKIFWRVASLLFVGVMLLVLVPLPWSDIRWGTAPEWVSALALLAITAAVWRIALPSGRQNRPTRGEGVNLQR